MPIEPGHVIAGKYRIVEQLGRGGMGSVWLAEHQLLGTHVAIKVIDYQGNDDDSVQRRFLQEAQSAAQIRSAHVVQIFDYGLDEGVPFIVMERLVGETLGSRLGREEVLDPELAATIFTQIGRAVQKAHDGGIVHRDLKPENVFLVKDDDGVTAKVLDFGIAKASRKPDPSHETTATGVLLGSPLYMSPEQAHGGKALDHRSDLWSLAVMVFESLTGRVPFRGQGWGELVAQICRDKPPVPSTIRPVPEGFDAWFEKAADRNPDRRFQSCREFMEALRPVLCPTSGVVKFVSTVPPAPLPKSDPNAASSDSTLDMREPGQRGDSGPKTPDTVVTTLRSTTGGVASSDRPPQRASRRGLAVIGLVAAAGIGFALLRQQLPAPTSGGSASASRPPETRLSSAPIATAVPTELGATTDAAPPSEMPVPSAQASTAAPPAVAAPPASAERETKTKAPPVRPASERGKPNVAPPRAPAPATGVPAAAAPPAPSDVLKSRE